MRGVCGLVLLAACSLQEPGGVAAHPEPVQAVVVPAPERDVEEAPVVPAPPALTSVTVTADDGHALAVHHKKPARPRAALVLVHGRTWSGLPDFDLQVPGESVSLMDALVAADIAAYAVDLRGYGATPRDATGFVTPRRSAADVAAVLKFVAEDAGVRPHLLGWSMGALVSTLVAQERRELTAGLVLYGYPCRAGRPTRSRAPEPTVPAKATNTAASAASDFITPGSVSRAVVDGFVAAALQADPIKADWRGGAEWEALDFARLRGIPVLVIHGERDPVTNHQCMAEQFLKISGGDRRWEIVAGGDHAAHLERTGFAAAVIGFVLSRRGG
ncbi:MAG: alpha/beta fold hydrolase [Myxococcales bacterium]|nr:alpha/beta fold hydrolase [Myxococcales bacterium]